MTGTETDRERLRDTFNQDAELYDRARPGYPPRMFDDLAELAGAGPGCRVLEIGCGTGKATVPLGPVVWIRPGSRGPARTLAALSSVGDAPRRLPPPPCDRTHRAPLPDPA